MFLRRRSRVLTNIGNAIKYSDPSKQKALILVGIVGLPNRARIDIFDNGTRDTVRYWGKEPPQKRARHIEIAKSPARPALTANAERSTIAKIDLSRGWPKASPSSGHRRAIVTTRAIVTMGRWGVVRPRPKRRVLT